ncbi:hypothetical protein J3L16_15860, partial [Alteromonas sp. 5E99-2]|uniref:phosphopantetheine-binding protein n=1 Tax=Alteromonas sp. 5E99-2 TaxID=2817683 RepID=UPI001A98223C
TQTPLETQNIQRELHESLPDYMVPGIIVVLDGLPLTPNGKVDRKALPAPELANINTYEAPEGDTEVALAGIWQEVLGVEQVGRHDNFFALGGHSLAAVQLLNKTNQYFELDLSLKQVIVTPSLIELSELISQSLEDSLSEFDEMDDLLAELEM